MTGDARELKGRTGLRRLVNAFGYSIDGFRAIWSSEQAFRQEFWLSVVLIPVALLLPVSRTQSALLAFSLFFLLIVETLNSAIEAAIDRIGPEIHPLSKKAKDLGSLAVLITLAADALIWVLVLLDAFW
ncbi:diacylglycerol kinase [Mesosutterella sp. OilRF-GAM-744-9]|uniref:Diacylglycerol kinase n=1 Tax=Mesosutterella porci TaxID=2915351 RepID=A0ABS9MP22_9BURK|nr:diacylglycerol kinase [Mesosutterella sp. oilRF-744-WT-GAM-9]MCG5030372.1 diacylglycerol kinase [Mesosutterella sp. oilRF-744-WT-GAM-9]MCI6530065.1 diacylglycerol kinase [Mesosutterella sp.]